MQIDEGILEETARRKLITYISHYEGAKIRIMEVCGSHTKAISEYGLGQILSPHIELVSGPGCPICVTPDSYLEEIRHYCEAEGNIIVCFGDLLRLPQMQGINRKSLYMVYSPLECLEIAATYPNKQVIFIAIAFETTAPLIALMIKEARALGLSNLKIWCGLKRMRPVLQAVSMKRYVEGYLYPGHVAVILGEKPFQQISKEHGIPGVIAGFKMDALLLGLGQLITLIEQGETKCINGYPQVVRSQGNTIAQNLMAEVFEERESLWRGIGKVPFSGYGLKERYKALEMIPREEDVKVQKSRKRCLCELVVTGQKKPKACPLWGKTCNPMTPQGVCMVSVEGACAIAYHFERRGENAKGR